MYNFYVYIYYYEADLSKLEEHLISRYFLHHIIYLINYI